MNMKIFPIILIVCSIPIVDDLGCHFQRLLEELRRLGNFSKLTHSSLVLLLDKLESESKIISTTDKHYIVFDF